MEAIAGRDVRPIDYDNSTPGHVLPPASRSIGLTEAQARERGYDVKVGVFPLRGIGRPSRRAAPTAL